MKHALRPAGGFTLVELLVVITIIGILVGMLLPAVQSAREAGRRAQCENNLHQIGLAAQQHVAMQGYFPSSGWGYLWTGDPDMGFGMEQPGGWVYNLLPYLELQSVYDIGKGLPSDQKRQKLAEQKAMPIATFICPTRRRPIAYPAVEGSYNSDQPSVLAKTDYAANGGTNRILGNATTDQDCPNKYPDCNFRAQSSSFNGVSGERSEVRPAKITDGLSNTYFAGEKYLNPDKYYSGDDGADNNSMYQGNDWDVNRWAAVAFAPSQDTPGLDTCSSRFGSAHFEGVNMVMCDGSVHLISYSIAPQIHEYLGNRADGKAISNEQWLP